MATLMRIVGNATALYRPEARIWLKAYDLTAPGGVLIEFTENRAEARRFADFEEAFETWRAVYPAVPVRRDGKPNRPLTAWTVDFEREDA